MSGTILRRRDRTARPPRVEHYSSAVNTSWRKPTSSDGVSAPPSLAAKLRLPSTIAQVTDIFTPAGCENYSAAIGYDRECSENSLAITGIRKEAEVPQWAAGQCIEGATVSLLLTFAFQETPFTSWVERYDPAQSGWTGAAGSSI